MPLTLNVTRITNLKKWFIEADYQVENLPNYEPEVAASPMTAFIDFSDQHANGTQ
ncbi:fatty acid cis/trans isomerase [Vibrio alfacsensis]|uniref:fatty acid cis/trans isomerase n=1 Tax=Vibrio alfacsensis TaxID=1074311 RepID=UPI0040687112